VQESATNIIPANTLIIATRIALGKTIKPTVACAINQDLKALITPVGINSDFLLYWIIANAQIIQELGSGTTVSGIRLGILNNLEIDLPPSPEQTRIVEKLEELFSDLDDGIVEIKAAQKKLIQYRQSLLKAAIEGQLTASWRAENKPHETGEQLLARILVERRRHWEEKRLAKFREQGKTPPEYWQDKYPQPVFPDTSNLPKLPQGWVWASLDMLGDIASGVAKGTKRNGKTDVREIPYLRVANVQRGYLDLSEIKTILATERDIEELKLQKGDVLFNEGGDRDKLGRGCVWQGEIENCIHQNHVFRMRPYMTELKDWVEAIL
jgi:type I restriction enzyme S subunit